MFNSLLSHYFCNVKNIYEALKCVALDRIVLEISNKQVFIALKVILA